LQFYQEVRGDIGPAMEPANPPAYEVLGKTFVEQFYTTFDANKENVIPMYHETALLTYEDHQKLGHQGIREVFCSLLKFNTIQHQVTKIDCQPVGDDGVLVFVTGRLQTDGDPPHAFSEVFLIKPQNNSYFIFHDLFRLSIHNSG